ncbi:MAG TPA: S24 family peptidase [Ignavibacteria bacterium]|nr:S24 family peptidase [Ignavibacteria bacterium]HRF65985.1 S24 family peptidase [Ignavibacteria bacterium]HRJ02826.1 S24 family peptidase [Ignavibacteria bacterium]HRJ84384.1 S24 family peptidase [Ignavibacteria bacterium]
MAKIGQNLRKWMLHKGVGFTQLTKRAGVSQGSLTIWLGDRGAPTSRNMQKIAEVLGVQPEDLYRSPYEPAETTIKPPQKLVPVLGYAACGSPAEHWAETTNKFIDAGDIGGLITPFVLVAKGRSMFPMIYEKDQLLCSQVELKQLKDEMLVVVSFKTIPDTADANAKLITLKKNSCTLYSINANYKPFDVSYSDIFKIYRVVRIIRDIK